jgi:ABC-type transporter Mla subunit MlaD
MNNTEYDLIPIIEELNEVSDAITKLNDNKVNKNTLKKQSQFLKELMAEANDLVGTYVNFVNNSKPNSQTTLPHIKENKDNKKSKLDHVLKEINKALHATCKAMRFGLTDRYKGASKNNQENLELSLLNIFSALDYFFYNENIEGFLAQPCIDKKLAKIEYFKDYSETKKRLKR